MRSVRVDALFELIYLVHEAQRKLPAGSHGDRIAGEVQLWGNLRTVLGALSDRLARGTRRALNHSTASSADLGGKRLGSLGHWSSLLHRYRP